MWGVRCFSFAERCQVASRRPGRAVLPPHAPALTPEPVPGFLWRVYRINFAETHQPPGLPRVAARVCIILLPGLLSVPGCYA